MRSIQARFNRATRKNPSHSSFVNFERAIKGQEFNRRLISKWFYKLVDRDDYDYLDRKELLAGLERLNNQPVER